MSIERQLPSRFGTLTATINSDTNVCLYSESLEYRDRRWHFRGFLIRDADGWRWQDSREKVSVGTNPDIYVVGDSQKLAPPTFRAALVGAAMDAWERFVSREDGSETVAEAQREKLRSEIESEERRIKELRAEIEKRTANVGRLREALFNMV